MAWSNKDLDPQLVSSVLLSAVQEAFSQAGHLPQSQEPIVAASDIEEYNGRMRVMGLDKMGNTCYVSVVNFYLNLGDAEHHKAKGALVVYLETESAGKIFDALGLAFSADEDDASMGVACGQLALKVAEAFKKGMSAKGFVPLTLSKPQNYKNNVVGGVPYSSDQKTKHDISFFYFRHKVLCVDLTLAPIPR